MMPRRRVLIISTVGLMYDGITSVITSYLETMDLQDLDIRLVGTIKIEPAIKVKIENLGCKIIDLPNRREETVKYFFSLINYIRRERIEVVHAHGNSATLTIELLAAKIGGAQKCIAHSHNTKCDQVRADKMLRPFFYHLYTDALACGEDAGKWLYGSRPFLVLKNGRNTKKYQFNLEIRNRMREQFGLQGELAIGHVGGFVEQKNHRFLISIFREVLKENSNAKLFLVGDGVLRKRIEEEVQDIKNSVIFIGNTDHVEDYLQMMDVMVLPSLFEGLPLVAIEWQMNGLPCIFSDVITQECVISDNVKFLSTARGAKEWANKIIANEICKDRSLISTKNIENARKKGFDITLEAKKLERLYTQS